MAENAEEIEIVHDNTDKDPEIEIVADDTGQESAQKEENKPIEPEEGIDALKAKLDAEKKARESADAGRIHAEKVAQVALGDVGRAKSEVHETNLTLVTNAIESVKQAQDTLEANYAQALQDGDYTAAAKAQRAMAQNETKLQRMEEGKLQLEEAAKAPKPAPQAIIDPVERAAKQMESENSPRSAQWIRQNPQFLTDPRLNQKMMAAHNLAIADGIQPDTDDYFEAIEGTLKMGRNPVSEDIKPPVRRDVPPAAAPVGGGSGGALLNGTKNRVTLTAAEREMAASMQMTEKEYALNKLALQREGKLN